MARKFMREKRVVLSILTVAIIASQLAGCAIISQKNLVDMANESPTVEIEIAEPVPDDETIKEMQKYMDNYTEDDIKEIAKHRFKGFLPSTYQRFPPLHVSRISSHHLIHFKSFL